MGKVNDSWTNRICSYYLVLPLDKYDCRGNDSEGNCGSYDEWKVLIGETGVKGGKGAEPVWEDGKVEVPFRDSSHMQWDNKSLGGKLPMYAVCGDKSSIIELSV